MRILTWACVLCACLLSASAKELDFDFGGLNEGAVPANFHSALYGEGVAPQWKILLDEVPSLMPSLNSNTPAMTHQGVLAQTAIDMTDEHFPMLIYDGDIFRDFTFSARFKIVSGISEQMAGLVFRFQNVSNFYVARVSSLGQNIRFYRVVNGVRSDPIGPMFAVPTGQWHTLSVQCEGHQITIRLDDTLVMPPLNDNAFPEGKVGFWTKSDSLTYFAGGHVDYAPRVPVAQQMVDGVMQKETKILDLRIYATKPGSTNQTAVIASSMPGEIGLAGTDAELHTITDGTTWYGTEHGAVLVNLPIRDNNGDILGAMHVKLRHYFTESQDAAVTRALMIRTQLEALCSSDDDFRK